MSVVMTLRVRDEEDILRENIEYHPARGVDFIIATANLSVDGTTQILKEYQALGVLHYIHQPEDDRNQHTWVTRIARMAGTRFGADWVINNDADEFWWPLQGSLKSTLMEQPAEFDALNVRRSNFVFLGHNTERKFWEKHVYRERSSRNGFGQPLPPKALHRAKPDLRVSQGNHFSNLPFTQKRQI